MYIRADTIDDLMIEVLQKLLSEPFNIKASKGTSSEIFGALLELNKPRARLSLSETRGKAFSALGELLWYLSGTNNLDFISHYINNYKDLSDDSKTIRGGYGPRLFNMRAKYNQIDNVISLLTLKPSSRRAAIQLFDASDLADKDYKDIPCTCFMQFLIRDEKLNMFVSMRSNDAYIGLPHDIFCFTMIQEIVARSLNIELGVYKHSVSSLHLYDIHKERAQQYINEGYQSITKAEMPSMPNGDPWESLETLKHIEEKLRNKEEMDFSKLNLDVYWSDLGKLLQIHLLLKSKNYKEINVIKNSLSSNIYLPYIEEKIKF